MNNTQFELVLLKVILVCALILFLSFLARIIRISVRREVKSQDDFICLLVIIALSLPIVYVYYSFKKKFKK